MPTPIKKQRTQALSRAKQIKDFKKQVRAKNAELAKLQRKLEKAEKTVMKTHKKM